jgi:putative ABC transport system permease protein
MGSLFMSLQIALAMVLVTGTGLMIRSLIRVENVDLGYQPRGLLLLHLDAPSGRQPAQFYDDVLGRISAIPGVHGVVVSNAYLETSGVPLLRGRYFAAEDDAASQPVAIVNQAMARRFWPDEDTTGKRFR